MLYLQDLFGDLVILVGRGFPRIGKAFGGPEGVLSASL